MTPGSRVAVVLGAGGPVGHAFHAGVLAALADAGWDGRTAELVVGTSIGAVTAALLRAGLAPADLFAHATGQAMSTEGAALVRRGWPDDALHFDLSRRQQKGPSSSPDLLRALLRSPRRFRLGLFGVALSPAGEVSTDVIVDGFRRVLGEEWPDRATRIVAVDLDAGERVVFGGGDGPLPEPGVAVAASCAVPSYFVPVEVDGRRYVDGGVLSPSNTDLVGADEPGSWHAVLASVPMGIGGWPNRAGVDLPGRLLNARQARRGLRELEAGGVPTVIFSPGVGELEVMHYDAFEMKHLPQIAERARAATHWRLRHDGSLASVMEILIGQADAVPIGADGVAGGTGTGGASPT